MIRKIALIALFAACLSGCSSHKKAPKKDQKPTATQKCPAHKTVTDEIQSRKSNDI